MQSLDDKDIANALTNKVFGPKLYMLVPLRSSKYAKLKVDNTRRRATINPQGVLAIMCHFNPLDAWQSIVDFQLVPAGQYGVFLFGLLF
jgi:hypothetical protein